MRLDELRSLVELVHAVVELLVLLVEHNLDDFALPLLLLKHF